MTAKNYPPITTPDRFAVSSKALMMGLVAWVVLNGEFHDKGDEMKSTLLGARLALQSAPFVMKEGQGAVSATPEDKAYENKIMDDSFKAAGIEIPAAEPVAV